MDFELTDEERMLKDTVARFVDRDVIPLAPDIDEKERFPEGWQPGEKDHAAVSGHPGQYLAILGLGKTTVHHSLSSASVIARASPVSHSALSSLVAMAGS